MGVKQMMPDKVNTGAMESACQDRIVSVMQIIPDESEVNTGAKEPAHVRTE